MTPAQPSCHSPIPNVLRPTLLYIISQTVIPAEAGIQFRHPGFRVKPGMTIKVKGLLTHYSNDGSNSMGQKVYRSDDH